MKKSIIIALSAVCLAGVVQSETLNLKILDGESWWGAADALGYKMPFTAGTSISGDLRVYHHGNQAAPIFLSDKGRYIWSDEPFAFRFENGMITITTDSAEIKSGTAGKTLREAYAHASKKFFPPSGKTPDLMFIAAPQYNTWIELQYDQNQKDILKYAKAILDNGLPPGVLMIDDTWQNNYGVWQFEASRFSDPKAMCKELHDMGFKVMFWVCPFVSMDSPPYRKLLKEGGLLCIGGNDPAPVKWWNGKSAVIDLTHPNGRKWFTGELDRLVDEFGVDGFKLDAGDPEFYPKEYKAYKKDTTPSDQCEAYAELGLEYAFNEYRACWKMAGQPLVQRLRDKSHEWSEVSRLVCDMIAAGLLGHSFICPDMIGGGEFSSFLPGSKFDPELFIRSTQVHALCPMMQFSASPWRILNKEHQDIVRRTVALRQKFAPKFVELAKECAKSGEPMLRSMEYVFPGNGYANVRDQFLMGNTLLVAPQMKKAAKDRTVVIPPGTWKADDGTVYTGPKTVTVSTPLERVPHFIKQ